MAWAFQLLQQRLDIVVILSGTHSHKQRRHLERYSIGVPVFGCQPTAQQPVDRPLKGVARAPHFVLYELRNIVVDGKSSSHIMML